MLAWTAVAAGLALPLARRRLRLPAAVSTAAVAVAPPALWVAAPRSRTRDAAVYALQMWAFMVLHELPYDKPERLERRVRVDYPITCDRLIGFGELPTVRLQRALGKPGSTGRLDRLLTFVHWAWFTEPHLAAAWILVRHPQRFPRSAALIGGVYDIGAIAYTIVPTAPPWWAAEHGTLPEVRRLMVEVGERFWGPLWRPLYDFLGGNPVAAMPSLHFATSVMAAKVLSEAGPVAGAVGWSYASVLGLALVYLGEHYAIDLIAGFALTAAVYRLAPRAAPSLLAAAGAVRTLEARARA